MSAEAYAILSCAFSLAALFVSLREQKAVVVIAPPLQTPPSLLERKTVELPDFLAAPNRN